MALIKCKECRKKISSEAKTCPRCGVESPTPLKPKHQKKKLFVLFIFLGAIAVFMIEGKKPDGVVLAPKKSDHELKVLECRNRGVEYYREIGSFPKLSDGRDATVVAKLRCEKTLTAF